MLHGGDRNTPGASTGDDAVCGACGAGVLLGFVEPATGSRNTGRQPTLYNGADETRRQRKKTTPTLLDCAQKCTGHGLPRRCSGFQWRQRSLVCVLFATHDPTTLKLRTNTPAFRGTTYYARLGCGECRTTADTTTTDAAAVVATNPADTTATLPPTATTTGIFVAFPSAGRTCGLSSVSDSVCGASTAAAAACVGTAAKRWPKWGAHRRQRFWTAPRLLLRGYAPCGRSVSAGEQTESACPPFTERPVECVKCLDRYVDSVNVGVSFTDAMNASEHGDTMAERATFVISPTLPHVCPAPHRPTWALGTCREADEAGLAVTHQHVTGSQQANQGCMRLGPDACAAGGCAKSDPCLAHGFSCPLCVSADPVKQAVFLSFGAWDAECSAATPAANVDEAACAALQL